MISEQHILNARILIVDDQVEVGRRLEGALRDRGHATVQTMTDPTLVAAAYEEYRPDIVLLDLAMPGLDGFGVMDELNTIESGSYLPVLMMIDAEADEESRLRALASPAKDILVKPIDIDEAYLAERRAAVEGAGAVFRTFDVDATMLASSKPVIRRDVACSKKSLER